MISFEELHDMLLPEIIKRMVKHQGLTNFASIRAKYEGWLKVELCDILSNQFDEVLPEQNRIDISFNDWVIELKTLNTNYRHNNVKKMHKPITNNVKGVINDIDKLRKIKNKKRGIIFTVYPVDEKNSYWIYHSNKITSNFTDFKIQYFTFKNGIPGLIYFGVV